MCVCVSMDVEPRLNDSSSPQPHSLFHSLVDKMCNGPTRMMLQHKDMSQCSALEST